MDEVSREQFQTWIDKSMPGAVLEDIVIGGSSINATEFYNKVMPPGTGAGRIGDTDLWCLYDNAREHRGEFLEADRRRRRSKPLKKAWTELLTRTREEVKDQAKAQLQSSTWKKRRVNVEKKLRAKFYDRTLVWLMDGLDQSEYRGVGAFPDAFFNPSAN